MTPGRQSHPKASDVLSSELDLSKLKTPNADRAKLQKRELKLKREADEARRLRLRENYRLHGA